MENPDSLCKVNRWPRKLVENALLTCEKKEMTAKLENLTKEMNQFTYIVSHDLQAPLRTITGFLELLEKRYSDKLDDSARQFIDFAKNGTFKMKKLVLDLLEYSRLSNLPDHAGESCGICSFQKSNSFGRSITWSSPST